MPDTDSSSSEESETPDEAVDDVETPQEPPAGSDDSDSGEDGLDEGAVRQIGDLRKENAKWRTKLRDAEAQLESLRLTPTDESAIEQARAEARAEAMTEAVEEGNRRIVRGEILAAAAGKLVDPEDAASFLDVDQFPVNDDGTVDREALAAAIGDLIARKPHLATSRQSPPTGAGAAVNLGTDNGSMDSWLRKAAGR